MNFFEDGLKHWVCPSDRELTLRAKLRTGWSSKANADVLSATAASSGQGAQRLSANPSTGINEAEQAAIAQVLERANKVQELEDERVRKLNEQLEKIKKQACGNGKRNCILCNDQPKFFGRFYTCKDCQNAVCNKCSIDTYELKTGESVWLCKICSESREVLKKTNMWTQFGAQATLVEPNRSQASAKGR